MASDCHLITAYQTDERSQASDLCHAVSVFKISQPKRFLQNTYLQKRNPPMPRSYYVYIMTNRTRTLYTGVTNNLQRRVYEHKHKINPGFTSKYNIDQLVYYEETNSIHVAIPSEKEIKNWLRRRKVKLIETMNPTWRDLSADWYADDSILYLDP